LEKIIEKTQKEMVVLEAQTNNKKSLCTYGEAHIIVKMSLKMVQGVWVAEKKPNHKPRMSEKEAGKYYNKKLNKYWHEMLKEEIPNKEKREKVIQAVCTNSKEYRRFCFKKRKENRV